MDAKLRALWAKKENTGHWLPLVTHMADTAETAKILWDEWVSDVIKDRISEDLPEDVSAREIFVFLAGVHDVGKASPAFQCKEDWRTPDIEKELFATLNEAGFPRITPHSISLRHEFIGYCVLERHGINKSLAVIAGGHHGTPPTMCDISNIKKKNKVLSGFTADLWVEVQDFFLQHALECSNLAKEDVVNIVLSKASQVLLSALVILADWFSSSVHHFPLMLSNDLILRNSVERAERAFKLYDLPPFWRALDDALDIFGVRFKDITTLYPVQEAIVEVVSKAPDLTIIEAPMGEGKTESALVAAEVIAKLRGCRGVYFALPTQATTNAMYSRVLDWIMTFESQGKSYDTRLLHSKSRLNKEFADIKEGKIDIHDEITETKSRREVMLRSLQVHEWFSGKKRGILADFTVGTIDQILMAGLKRKHLVLRHLGLAGKVVIIDECHAYDVYMQSYLQKALSYLGAYKVPVIILSATLPKKTRQKLVNAYLDIDEELQVNVYKDTPTLSYPQITYLKDGEVFLHEVGTSSRKSDVSIRSIRTEDIETILRENLTEGGYAGVIVNTVRKAQELYLQLSKIFPDTEIRLEKTTSAMNKRKDTTDTEVTLLHSGFIQTDRALKEEKLVAELGRKVEERAGTKIVIGTQIFEQSLDVDFDILITDLCPMDLLIQRIGRLHRHYRLSRPPKLVKPVCYVLDTEWGGFDKGSQVVYGPYLLAKTKANLPEVMCIPEDIPTLVEYVYGGEEPCIPSKYLSWYKEALRKYEEKINTRQGQSETFQVNKATGKSTLIGWLESGSVASESSLESSVRGIVGSIEVIPVVHKQGKIYSLVEGYDTPIPLGQLSDEEAKLLASGTLRLPFVFSIEKYKYEKYLDKIKEEYGFETTWCESNWLRSAYFLVLDENLTAKLGKYELTYSKTLGITYKE